MTIFNIVKGYCDRSATVLGDDVVSLFSDVTFIHAYRTKTFRSNNIKEGQVTFIKWYLLEKYVIEAKSIIKKLIKIIKKQCQVHSSIRLYFFANLRRVSEKWKTIYIKQQVDFYVKKRIKILKWRKIKIVFYRQEIFQ